MIDYMINHNPHSFSFSDLILIKIWLLQITGVPQFKKTLSSFLPPSLPIFLSSCPPCLVA